LLPIWIEGTSLSGKTSQLINYFSGWINENQKLSALVFSANNQNRSQLADKIAKNIQNQTPIVSKTPLGFFQDEIIRFWPLLSEQLQIKAQFPLGLRPETEQEFARKLWQDELKNAKLPEFTDENRLIRNILDLLQLAGAGGIKLEKISDRLTHGLLGYQLDPDHNYPQIYAKWGQMIEKWKSWCLNNGFLTYGLIYHLYDQFLLPNDFYQQYLLRHYDAIFADDLDDYPAITRHLFDRFLDQGKFAVFTYNPNGQTRLGINADPEYLKNLANRCQRKEIKENNPLTETAVKLLRNFDYNQSLPESVMSINAITRASLLRKVCDFIIVAVKEQRIKPEEIAIVTPGLDAIARYAIIEILKGHDLNIELLHEQKPLVNYAHIRSLLTLLCLTYQGLGHLATPDTVGEMLIILSQKPRNNSQLTPEIDPVRAGLLIDHCYQQHQETPLLLDFETNFPQWGRLGFKTSSAYQRICQWIEAIKKTATTPLAILDKAIKDFFYNGMYFNAAEISALRELMETAAHYWQVNQRCGETETIIGDFVQLLRQGTITSNPKPVGLLRNQKDCITLATVFQYRQERTSHRWLFLLDTKDRLWEKGGSATLFASPIFLQNWHGKPLTLEDQEKMNEERLIRIVKDLLSRFTEKVYLCHSDLDIKGREQFAGLSSLIYATNINT
jgi:hypothetical protein